MSTTPITPTTPFTNQELDILLEAMNAWESEPARKGMFSGIMLSMFAKDKESLSQVLDEKTEEVTARTKEREEAAILLKAKIIQLRREYDRAVVALAAEYMIGENK